MKKVSFYAEAFLASNSTKEDMAWIGVMGNRKAAKKIKDLAYSYRFDAKILAKNLEMPQKVANFICLIGKESMFYKISEIINKVKALAIKNKFSFAEIYFAKDDYTAEDLNKIIKKLENLLKVNIIASTAYDKYLISGFKIKLPHQTFDLSLKNKINQFSKQLFKAGEL